MKYARKFRLVPDEGDYNTSLDTHKSALDEEMRKILKRKLDDDTKWTLYQQALHKYLKKPEKDILENMSSQYKDRAVKLLDTLHNDIAWESDGTVSVDNKVIPNSHIAELAEAALNPSKPRPTGWNDFAPLVDNHAQWEEWPPKKSTPKPKRSPKPRKAKQRA